VMEQDVRCLELGKVEGMLEHLTSTVTSTRQRANHPAWPKSVWHFKLIRR